MAFRSLEELMVAAAEIVRPPERLTVVEASERYRYMNNPGSFVGPYSIDVTPYLEEPMNLLPSLDYTALIFVGPAQCAKTDWFLNWVTHSATCDPADMTIFNPTQASSRDFSMRRMRRLFRHSKEVGARLIPGRQNQNTFDFHFLSGWMLTLSWPTISEMSGKPIPRLWLSDYDRMPESVDEEGSPFDLARKRATTFRKYGMTVAESSPGRDVENPKWMPSTPHEAPPTTGILALYNRGDRRRFYWPCPHCDIAFEPDFQHLVIPDSKDFVEAAEQTVMACPTCAGVIPHDPDELNGVPGKHALNAQRLWLRDGEYWTREKGKHGSPMRSDIASFWLKGPCAAMQDWKTIALNYLKAVEEFERTGSAEALRTTTNIDQGLPFKMPLLGDERLPENIKNECSFDLGEKVVPEGVRFLVAAIDIQKHRFVVQVHGIGEGLDQTLIDRFDIKKSERLDEDGERYLVNPGGYLEDWKLLAPQVLEKTYPLADGSGRSMQIKVVGCDSGGREGVTKNAYNFWRWLRDEHDGEHHRRFRLVKGDSKPGVPRVRVVYPDSERKDRHAGALGEIPVLMLGVNQIKDQNDKMFDRKDAKGGRIIFPNWLSDEFYSELTAERRTSKGWENPKNLRNEAWDLWCYITGLTLSRLVKAEQIDWENPPSWASTWDKNDLIVQSGAGLRFASKPSGEYDLAKLGADLA